MQIDLPFPFGKQVYTLSFFHSGVLEGTIIGYTITQNGTTLICSRNGNTTRRTLDELGTKFFDTIENAEAALNAAR